MAKNTSPSFPIWQLPECLLYHITEYAAPPTQRASILCHSMASLCRASANAILEEHQSVVLWDLVLVGDYHVKKSDPNLSKSRRSCKRLRRSPVDQVRDAHKLLQDNTEIAYFYLSELCSSACTNNSLTRSKMCGILDEFGPHLMYNKAISSGGTFLVEVCRAKHASSSAVLHCVRELVEQRGALVNFPSHESHNAILTPLCVASVRGMPKLVDYLLQKGASMDIPCSGRFRLHTNSKKSLRCNKATALEFANSMIKEEQSEGANKNELRDLNRCIQLLSKHNTVATPASRSETSK